VIVKFGDTKIDKTRQLPTVVSAAPVGQKVDVEILRDGKPKTLSVEVGKLAEEEEPTRTASRESRRPGSQAFGVRIEDLTPSLRERLNVKGDGAVISEVDPDGPAARAGIQPGDVVVEVDRKPVKHAADLASALDSSGKRA